MQTQGMQMPVNLQCAQHAEGSVKRVTALASHMMADGRSMVPSDRNCATLTALFFNALTRWPWLKL
jgi:hypothetical protein